MKSETLQALLTARILLERAQEMCYTDDRYVASAGLVTLQDGLELVLYAALVELGVDEDQNIERWGFDELVAEVRKSEKAKLIKQQSLKALNKERVLVKHYGQLAEPAQVRQYSDVARQAIDTLLKRRIGRTLADIYLEELLHEGEAKGFIRAALAALANRDYLEGLVEVRKALFVEIEAEYAIDRWLHEQDPTSLAALLARRGSKAPYYAKNRDHALKIREPCDYIVLDHDALRLDLLEWGASTQDFWNLRRLTPAVFRYDKGEKWFRKQTVSLPSPNEATLHFCIDRALSLLIQKHRHADRMARVTSRPGRSLVRLTTDSRVLRSSSAGAEVAHEETKGEEFLCDSLLDGEDGRQYVRVQANIPFDPPPSWFFGYLPITDVEVIEDS